MSSVWCQSFTSHFPLLWDHINYWMWSPHTLYVHYSYFYGNMQPNNLGLLFCYIISELKIQLMNVIFEKNFISVWVLFQGISALNCMICARISTIMFGFTCLRSVCRFWSYEPEAWWYNEDSEVLWIKEDSKRYPKTPNTDKQWTKPWLRRIQDKQRHKN